MHRNLTRLSLIFTLVFFAACTPPAQETRERRTEAPAESFDAEKSWVEFDEYFNLFYAYSDRMDFDVEIALRATQTRSLETTSKEAFRRELVKFGHVFADPHIIIGPLSDSDYNVVPTSSDIRMRYRNGNYVVEDVRARSAADEADIRPGFVLLAVDRTPIESLISDIFLGLVEVPTPRQKSHAATLLANGKRTGDRTLTFEGGQTMTLPNPRVFAKSLQGQDILSVSYEGEIAVIRLHNSLGNNDIIQAFDAAMRETASAKGLILDFRETPSGGNTEVARAIIGHFVNEARPYQTHTIPSLEREFSVPRMFTEYVLPRAPYGLVIGLDGAANMHVIASDMGDLLGGLSNYILDYSGIRLDLPSETLSHIDGTPRHDFVADVALISSDRDAAGGDPALDAALSHLRSGKKLP